MSFLSKWILTKVLALPLTAAFSVSHLAETLWRFEIKTPPFHYSNNSELDISVRPRHPLYVSGGPACVWRTGAQKSTETFMLGYFYFKDFFPFFSYFISDATLCKFIELNYSLIEIKSLNVDQHGFHWIWNIYGTVPHVFVCFAFWENTHATLCCWH